MSLMNDALRKKKRETVKTMPGNAAGGTGHRPPVRIGWFVVMAVVVVLVGGALGGLYLLEPMMSGSALQLKHDQGPRRAAAGRPDDPLRIDTGAARAVAPDGGRKPAAVEAAGDVPGPPIGRTEAATIAATDGERLSTPAHGPSAPSDVLDEAGSQNPVTLVEAASEAAAGKVDPNLTEAVSLVEPGPTTAESGQNTITADPPGNSAGDRATQREASPARTTPAPLPQPQAPMVDSEPDAQVFYRKAVALHRSGRLEKAIRLYRQTLASAPGQPEAMLNLAAALMAHRDFAQARELLDRLADLSPRPGGVLLNRAIVKMEMGHYDAALSDLDQAEAEVDADGWDIRFHRAVVFARSQRTADAMALYRQLAMQRPDDPRVQLNLAITLDALGRYEAALDHYRAVLQAPDPPPGFDEARITRRVRTLQHYINTGAQPAVRQ